MNLTWKILLAAVFLLSTMTSSADARPSFGASCADCHTRADGNFELLPSDLLTIPAGNTGEITFNVTDLAAEVDAHIGINGLDAVGLMATPDLTNWDIQTDDTENWLTSDHIDALGPVVLQLMIGSSATLADYSIDATLAGGSGPDGSRWSTTRSFTIRVIPEPMSTALLGVALISGGIAVRRQIRRRKAHQTPH